ncbi:MAG TPA: 4Fe-4S binding protein [Thermoplasmata archaeon]|nr:4Fe-4S binding protein [Thermoplasmata archaeon]HIH97790.1 4Fe-4S binding protein [Thermoplasmata archaeon]
MKQLTIISGKGGTGKTTIAVSFASLAKQKVLADCDVDAPDMHLILKPRIIKSEEFRGSKRAVKNDDLCTDCGRCEAECRYGAIKDLRIDPIKCEGCGVCVQVCPTHAISLRENISGCAFISETRYGPMAHARLNIAEEASGKLVSVVRENAKQLAEKHKKSLIIIDGPPGIGCPVIASLTGVDLALIVTEPTLSGIHDLKRIYGVAKHFRIRSLVCINKHDLNEENTGKIEDYCRESGIEVVGKILFDQDVTRAMIAARPFVEFSQGNAASEIERVWRRIEKIFL